MPGSMISPQSILITGGSSGIGAALAAAYAEPGVTLFLCGRDRQRLEEVAQTCRDRGAAVDTEIVDVADRQSMQSWIDHCESTAPLELVVANAGIANAAYDDQEATRRITATNVDGVLNTVLPAIEHMRPRQRGQIAIVSSLAGFRGLPSAPDYCAGKAFERVWGEGLRGLLAAEGIAVNVICPGFVQTRITDANEFPRPQIMPPERAAAIIQRGLRKNKSRIVFPRLLGFATWLFAILSPTLTDGLVTWLARRPQSKSSG